jgi:signal transduction histidine kinase
MALELKALMQSRAQLATLAERQRLARDLHDTVKQQAFALNLQLATLRRQLVAGPSADRAAQAELLSGRIQQELAQILDELRASDSALPFIERLRMRALGWAQISGIALETQLADTPTLAPADQETLLRIADEALANILRHSGATRVSMILQREGDVLTLSIADNGSGKIADAPPGMGIANMRERAASLPRGRFSIDSGPVTGTLVRISFAIAA